MARQLSESEFKSRVLTYLPKGIPADAVASVECDPTDGEDGRPSYWVYFHTGYISEGGIGCHTIHEDTLKEIKAEVKRIVYVEDDEGGY